MSSNADVALISGGFTALVGLAGFGAAIYNNRKTIKAAREQKILDLQADIYTDVLAAVHYRNARRAYDIPTKPVDEPTRRKLEAYLGAYRPADWYQLEARQLAYASSRVVTAVQGSVRAHAAAITAYIAWQTADGKIGVETPELTAAERARQAANDADGVVIEEIRRDLLGRGHAIQELEDEFDVGSPGHDAVPHPSQPPEP